MSITRSGSASARDEILEAACAWFDRMQDDGQTLDRAALDRWLRERPEHRVAFETVRSAHARARTAVEDPAILALRHETALRLTRRARRSRWASLAAALAAIAVGAAIWVQLDLSDGGSRLPLIAQALRSLGASERGDYATRIGERLVVTLADGSRVTLNTNTKLREVFDRTERRVVLDHGQALFEVAHDTVRPFVVEAHDRRLVALGTAFDVRVDGTRVQVTMLEGIVAVERTSGAPDVGIDGSGEEEAVPL
ncbi:MAG TPA: FecR domain-containing protein, partial [Steroidobacteraceae bacterium]|nr:FecR domain-containing protein [Steroidobacteraceae bacterium]